MKLVVLSVRDLKAEVYSRPFYVGRLGEGLRSFQDEVLQGDAATSLITKHPADFQLWCLAQFDDETGQFEPDVRLVASGSDFAK